MTWNPRVLPKREKQMPHPQFLNSSVLLANKEMQIKTTLRDHLTPVRMTIVKKTKDKICMKPWEKKRKSKYEGMRKE